MVYCVIVMPLLAFITAVCSKEISRNLTKSDINNIVQKNFSCNISQQVILQNTFSIRDLFKYMIAAIATLQVAMEKSTLKSLQVR